ncbi:zinc finger protein 628 [Schistocerca nitens]|uniref:zinc finger protein 628 n=1 Tax=Schistocerca nitens TaxID=7011 RepID=UPI002118ACD8|nr:zinc finger protein 628 [Schistocerca nitens]
MEEEDDDTHLCLKCRATITGLDNYVQHRKAGCPPRQGQELRADDFFSSLELQSSAKKAAAASATPGTAAGSNERAGRDTDEEEEEEEYSDGEEFADFEEEGPPRGHTGGKWRPSAWAGGGAASPLPPPPPLEPPPSFTGGKWRPQLSPQEHRTGSPPHHQQEASGGSSTSGRWPETEQPKEQQQQQQQARSRQEPEDDDEEEEGGGGGPPPGHTSGKWVPGGRAVRKQGSTVQYWCGACCRRLSSRALYQRHLQSELHFKRTLLERQLESSRPPQLQPQQRPRAKRVVRRTAAYINSHLWAPSKRRRLQEEADRQAASQVVAPSSPPPPATTTAKQRQHQRQRHKRLAQCEACRARLQRHQWGQHLLSHYHWQRGAASAPQLHRQLVLRHMPAIARLAPFRCQPCHFYFNTSHNLEQHVRSREHRQRDTELQGDYWCSLCRASCDSAAALLGHLRSQAHGELVAAAAGSLPVEVRRRRLPWCADCGRRFQLRAQVLAHARRRGHFRALRLMQRVARPCLRSCAQCSLRCQSWGELQRHVKKAHGRELFFCSACSLEFGSSAEALAHRRSTRHRHTAIQHLAGPRRCHYCPLTVDGLPSLQQHIRAVHPNLMSACAMCGMKFPLAQQLARHVRDKACTFPAQGAAPEQSRQEQPEAAEATSAVAEANPPQQVAEEPQQAPEETAGAPPPSAADRDRDPLSTAVAVESEASEGLLKEHACSQCPYRCSTRVDLLFHTVLHGAPSKSQLQCPECGAVVSKRALRSHLRVHTGERPLWCADCGGEYPSRAALLAHQQRAHSKFAAAPVAPCAVCGFRAANAVTMRRHARLHAPRPRNFVCAKCGKAFYDKTTLQQHEKVHSGKTVPCDHAGCMYRCRSLSELAFHRRTHSDERSFHCDGCNFSTKTKSQLVRHVKMHLNERAHRCQHCSFSSRVSSHLRRHMRVHTGAKPFRCPHCTFTCSSLENLRKHVLSTAKHQGKYMYQCHLCDFGCNMAADFRAHLVVAHPNAFPDSECAASYATGIYQRADDPVSVDHPLERQPRKRKRQTKSVGSSEDPPVVNPAALPTVQEPESCVASGGSADNLKQLQPGELTAQPANEEVSSVKVKSEPTTLHSDDRTLLEPEEQTVVQSPPKRKLQSSTSKSATSTASNCSPQGLQTTSQTAQAKHRTHLVTATKLAAQHPVGSVRQLTPSVPPPLQVSPLSIQIPVVPTVTTQIQPKIAIPAIRNSTAATAARPLVGVSVPQLQTFRATTGCQVPQLLVQPAPLAFILSQPGNVLQKSSAIIQPKGTASPALVTVRAESPRPLTPSVIQLSPSVIGTPQLQLASNVSLGKTVRPLALTTLSSVPGAKESLITPATISSKAQTQAKFTRNVVVKSQSLQNAVQLKKATASVPATGKKFPPLLRPALGVTLQKTAQSSVTATTSVASLTTQMSGTPSDHRDYISQTRSGVATILTTIDNAERPVTASSSETQATSSIKVEDSDTAEPADQR